MSRFYLLYEYFSSLMIVLHIQFSSLMIVLHIQFYKACSHHTHTLHIQFYKACSHHTHTHYLILIGFKSSHKLTGRYKPNLI